MKRRFKILKTVLSATVILIYIALIVVLMAQALTPGSESANISQSFGEKVNQAITDIKKPVAERVDVLGVEINAVIGVSDLHGEAGISVGGQGIILASVYPGNATNPTLGYCSDNEEILAVYPDGRIVAKSRGIATVTVTSLDDPSRTASVTINVVSIPLQSIEIEDPEAIRVGDSIRLEIEYYPAEASEREVTWHTSDDSIITVDERGTVTAVSEGEARIYAISSENDSITSEVTITVLPPIEEEVILPTGIKLTSPKTTYAVGDVARLVAELQPEGASGKVIWYSTNESVVSVRQNGSIVCHRAGEAEIIARSGSLEGRIKITVDEILSKNIYLSFVDMEFIDGVYTVKQGSSAKVIATLDDNATILDVKFSSSDESIAKIGADGVIEARRGGKVTITVSTSYGDETTSTSFVLEVSRITLEDTIDNFYLWVRKALGHFGAFLVLGIFASITYCIAFKKNLRGRLIAFIVCILAGFAVAGITEILQLPAFTTGRFCSFSDVMLDFAGYCTSAVPIYAAVILVHIVMNVARKIKAKAAKM